jgi:hypothetical protein
MLWRHRRGEVGDRVIDLFFFNLAAGWGLGGQCKVPAALPWETSVIHCTEGWAGPGGRSGRVWKILPPPGLETWTEQYPVSQRLMQIRLSLQTQRIIHLCEKSFPSISTSLLKISNVLIAVHSSCSMIIKFVHYKIQVTHTLPFLF